MLTIGRIVHYTLSASDAEAINRRRSDFSTFLSAAPKGVGYVGHVGNYVDVGEVYPAVIVRVFGANSANLQVLLDGNDTYWATSRVEGEGPNTWKWPDRV